MSEEMNMKCETARTLLVSLADHEPVGPRAGELIRHMEQCAECRALLEALKRDRETLRGLPAPRTAGATAGPGDDSGQADGTCRAGKLGTVHGNSGTVRGNSGLSAETRDCPLFRLGKEGLSQEFPAGAVPGVSDRGCPRSFRQGLSREFPR